MMNKFLKIITAFFCLFLCACTSNNKTVVVIDAGHTESDPGLKGIITEYSYTRSLGDALSTLLEENDTYEVLYIHDISLTERVQEIKENNADIVISIHASASSDTSVTGMHVIAEPKSDESLKLAEMIASKLDTESILCYAYYEQVKDNVYEEKYISTDEEYDESYETMELMEALDIPIVQIEGLYVTSQDDVESMTSEEMLEKVAEAIYSAIQEVYE